MGYALEKKMREKTESFFRQIVALQTLKFDKIWIWLNMFGRFLRKYCLTFYRAGGFKILKIKQRNLESREEINVLKSFFRQIIADS